MKKRTLFILFAIAIVASNTKATNPFIRIWKLESSLSSASLRLVSISSWNNYIIEELNLENRVRPTISDWNSVTLDNRRSPLSNNRNYHFIENLYCGCIQRVVDGDPPFGALIVLDYRCWKPCVAIIMPFSFLFTNYASNNSYRYLQKRII